MRKSSAPHGQFFNSLKQVEKRLKLESKPPHTTVPPPPSPPQPLQKDNQSKNSITQNSDSFCSPMYIIDEPLSNSNNTFQETQIPQQFSSNPNFPSIQNNPQEENHAATESCNASDEIGLLMEQLGLSDSAESSNIMGSFGLGCDDGFYEKVVGVKGLKNANEVERMEGWIKCFLNDGEVKEPFKLVHLLLGKAAFVHSGDGDDGFGEFEFPCTVSEFLRNDPPVVD